MNELIKNKDRTVIIVSHSLDLLRELCNKILWIDNGIKKIYGDTEVVINEYIKFMKEIK